MSTTDTTNPVDDDVRPAVGDPAAARWVLTWETGPDAGSSVVLGACRTLVGRAGSAGVRCDDPALEPHHALLIVDGDRPRLIQLTGRAPVVVDGRDASDDNGEGDGDGVILDDGMLVELGHSTLRARHRRPPADERVNVRGGAVLRSPRAQPRWDPTPLIPPATEPERAVMPAGLVPALCAAVAAVALAVVLDQWMLLAFGGLGLFVAAGTWLAQRVGGLRRSRRGRRVTEREWADYAAAAAELRDAYVEHVAEATTTLAGAMSTVATHDHRLWSRRGTDPDAYVVSLGAGDAIWRPPGAADDRPVLHVARHRDPPPALHTTAVLHHQPITVDLGDGARLALRGADAWTSAIARSLVVQLAANCGPADVRLMVVTEHPATWDWVAELPHGVAPDGSRLVVEPNGAAAAFAALDQPGNPHVVVVTDAAEQLASRTSALRRTMDSGRQPAMIVLVDAGEPTPAVCTAELQCPSALAGAGGWARWRADLAGDDVPAAVRLTGLGQGAAVRIAAELHPLVDPDDPFAGDATLPTAVSLAELLQAGGRPLTPAGILARWDAAGSDVPPRAPIGRAADGVVDLDLVRDGPHGLIAGTTGSGKSELLRSLVAGMAVGAPPEQLAFVLVDYKGGATFDACAELPHVVGLVTDLDERLADRMLRSLHAELRRREAVLRAHDVADLAGLRAVAATAALPRLVVVIDEFAALVGEQPTFLHTLVGIAQRGRSLGVHLLLATQRPGGILSDDIRANTNIRCALRLPDSADALDVVGNASPVSIPRRAPGRAVLRLGPDEHLSFQGACCATELTAIVRAVVDAARSRDVPAPPRPWCPSLPDVLAEDDPRLGADDGDGDDRGVLGLIDDPDRQRQLPLRWAARGGHVLVGGGHGSGLTSTLRSIAVAAIEADPDAHVYAVDARGGHGLDCLAELPSCAGVVRTHEPERLRRLLVRLGDELGRRAGGGAAAGNAPVLLLVDGFGELRPLLAEPATETERAALERILVDGAACGVVAVLAVGHPGAVPPSVLAHCPRRWLHHVVDRHDALAWGYAIDDVPPPIPGRVLVAPGLHAQLLARQIPAIEAGAAPTVPPAPIQPLPREVDPMTIGRGHRGPSGGLLLPAGLGFDSGAPVDVEVPDGEHVLIVGPARSGRTTALWRLVDAWREANPSGWSAVLAPRHRGDARPGTHAGLAELVATLPPSGPALVAVDDAELVADHDGAPTLASLAAGRRPGLLIVAAGSADALRQSYGHWVGVVRRSRLGVILAAANDLDGDLLGASLPRRRPIPARPGLAWIVSGGELQLVQLARPPCRAPVPPVA